MFKDAQTYYGFVPATVCHSLDKNINCVIPSTAVVTIKLAITRS